MWAQGQRIEEVHPQLKAQTAEDRPLNAAKLRGELLSPLEKWCEYNQCHSCKEVHLGCDA